MTDKTPDEAVSGRIVPLSSLTAAETDRVLARYGLSATGPAETIARGRIASNLLVSTRERGEVIIRIYPSTFSAARVLFEIEALHHMALSGLPVPSPLDAALEEERGPLMTLDDRAIFVYAALAGTPVPQESLTEEISSQAGRLLAKCLTAAETFPTAGARPAGDLEFIQGLHRAHKEVNPEFASLPEVAAMDEALLDETLSSGLARTPRGLVHADYFFENVLEEEGHLVGLLDFGDAYMGYLLNDVVIGAMEFSVGSDEDWDLVKMKAFLMPLSQWLCGRNISPDLCCRLLAANCVRFAVYTIPFTRAEGGALEDNPYVRRFKRCTDPVFRQDLERTFAEGCGQSG